VWPEELREAAIDRCEFIPRRHGLVLSQRLGDEQEQVVRLRAQVALPEVEKVHVVDGGLPALDFQDDSARV
jgi:hypothetical protein